MKKSLVVSGLGALLIVVASGVVQAQQASTRNTRRKVIYVVSGSATYKQMPTEKASMAVLWGDPDKGVHGTFTKFEPGFDAGMHTHTSDVWIVFYEEASGKFDSIPAK